MIKVGASSDPEVRRRALYGDLIHTVEIVPPEMIGEAEAYAHYLLRAVERGSEWYDCTKEQAMEAVNDAARRIMAGESLDTPKDPARSNKTRGLLLASRRRAELTAEKLKIAIPMWRDRQYTVRDIENKSGLSRRTLYEHLPPRGLWD